MAKSKKPALKVQTYRNLHAKTKNDHFSIRHKGIVIDHRPWVHLRDVTFKHPTKKALNQVRATHRRVVAWIRGSLFNTKPDLSDYRPFCVDPKLHDHFIDAKTKKRIDTALAVYISTTKLLYKPKKD